jgi:peptide/nickel transport system substrate-binding protein
MNKHRPWTVLANLFLLAALLLAACSPATDAPPTAAATQAAAQPTVAAATPTQAAAPTQAAESPTSAPTDVPAVEGPTGTVIVGQAGNFGQMDPQITQLSTERATHHAMFDPLLTTDANMIAVPHLATEWTQISDTEWEFKLREDVTFHNGEPFDAETVVFNVERVLREGFQRFAFLAFLDHAEAVDQYTVRIATKQPFPQFFNRLAQFYMVPRQYLEEVGDEAFNLAPVGSGPWKFVEWVADSHVQLEANLDYWGGAPKAQFLTWRVIPDSITRVNALFAGEVDAITGVSPDIFPLIEGNPDLDALSVDSLRTPFFFMYPESPSGYGAPLADVRVRQAINYAVNVQGIIDALLGGEPTRTANLMIPTLACYDGSIEPYPFDPDMARALLADAGYEDGFTLDMNAPSTGIAPKGPEIAQAVVADLARVGITVILDTPDLQTLLVKQRERAFPALQLWSYGGGAADPDDKFWSPYSTEATNHLLYTDEMQELIAQGRSTLDMEERCTVYQRLQQIVKEEAIILPLFAQKDLYASRAGLEWEAWPNELVLFNNATATRP